MKNCPALPMLKLSGFLFHQVHKKWFNKTVLFQINHKYYVSEVVGHGQRYWRDIKGHPNTTTHQGLSDQFLRTQAREFLYCFIAKWGFFFFALILSLAFLIENKKNEENRQLCQWMLNLWPVDYCEHKRQC